MAIISATGHRNDTDTAIATVSTFPTTAPTFVGQTLALELTAGGSAVLRANGTTNASNWRVISQNPRVTSTVPVGNITPAFVGQIIHFESATIGSTGSESRAVFVAEGATSSDWAIYSQQPAVTGTNPEGTTTGQFQDQLIIYVVADRRAMYRSNAAGVWVRISQSTWVAANNPTGNRTPDFIGQLAWDSRATGSGGQKLYVSSGLTSSDWVILN